MENCNIRPLAELDPLNRLHEIVTVDYVCRTDDQLWPNFALRAVNGRGFLRKGVKYYGFFGYLGLSGSSLGLSRIFLMYFISRR